MPKDTSLKGKHGKVHEPGRFYGLVGEITEAYRDNKFPNRDTITLQLPGEGSQTFPFDKVEIFTHHPDGTRM